MEDKIIEVFKKYSKSVDTEYNVYNCLIEEDWSNIAEELVKLFCQPAVISSVCDHPEEALIRDKPTPYCLACNKNIPEQTDL
jgi:hypothetical protein